MIHLGTLHATLVALGGAPKSIVNLDRPGHYVHWHFIQISVANLIVIASMVAVFLLAILVPFPGHRSKGGQTDG
jgi:hypothetical protein